MLTSTVNNSLSGAHYLLKGTSLIRQKGLRRFVIVPLCVNLLLFATAFYYLFLQLNIWIAQFEAAVPGWLSWLTILLWPLAFIGILLLFSLFFSVVANLIAAPFCGILAEKTERLLTGQPVEDSTFSEIIKDLPRVLKREWHKLAYYLPRATLLLLLFLVPVIGWIFAPILWFAFGAWMVSLQYVDFCFDNHQISFSDMKQQLQADRSRNLGFGAVTLFFTSTPIVNLFIMPIAVCGATAMYVDHYRNAAVNTTYAIDTKKTI